MITDDRQRLLQRGIWLEGVTIVAIVVEGVASLVLGYAARSVSLVAFGLDSVIELVAAMVLFVRLRAELSAHDPEIGEEGERRALRVVGWTFFALAAYVVVDSIASFAFHHRPERSIGGVVVAMFSLVAMPLLGREKLAIGRSLGSKALVADAKETFSCAAIAATVLVGVGANALFGWWWADLVAAIAIVPFLVREGREALEEASGEGGCSDCGCHDA